LAGRGEIEGNRIEEEGIRVWSSLSRQWPSRRVKSTRNEECLQGGVLRGHWQIKVVSELTGMGPHATRVFANVGQILPRTSQEGLALHHTPKRQGVSAPGMASASLLQKFSSGTRPRRRSFHKCDRSAPTPVQQPCFSTAGPTLNDWKIRLVLALQAELARRPAPLT